LGGLQEIFPTGDRFYDFEVFSQKNWAKKIGVLTQNTAKLCKNWIIKKKRQFFLPKIGKKSQKIVIMS
jgi:hypothetical protein